MTIIKMLLKLLVATLAAAFFTLGNLVFFYALVPERIVFVPANIPSFTLEVPGGPHAPADVSPFLPEPEAANTTFTESPQQPEADNTGAAESPAPEDESPQTEPPRSYSVNVTKLVYVQNDGLYLKEDGKQPVELVSPGSFKRLPTLSPDGRRVAYLELSPEVDAAPRGALRITSFDDTPDITIDIEHSDEIWSLRWANNNGIILQGGFNAETNRTIAIDATADGGKILYGVGVSGNFVDLAPDNHAIAYVRDSSTLLINDRVFKDPKHKHISYISRPVWDPQGRRIAITAVFGKPATENLLIIDATTLKLLAVYKLGELYGQEQFLDWNAARLQLTDDEADWTIDPDSPTPAVRHPRTDQRLGALIYDEQESIRLEQLDNVKALAGFDYLCTDCIKNPHGERP